MCQIKLHVKIIQINNLSHPHNQTNKFSFKIKNYKILLQLKKMVNCQNKKSATFSKFNNKKDFK